MSLVPMMFSNWWEELDSPHHLYDQHFGMSVSSEDLMMDPRMDRSWMDRSWMQRQPRRYWQRAHPYEKILRQSQQAMGYSTVFPKKDKFQVNLDVQQFAPNEISVKISGKHIVVEGKHEDKQDDHGWISRQFVRKYIVPEQCDIEQMQSHLSSDGILTMTAPRKEQLKPDERMVRIQQTGQPAQREGVMTNQQTSNSREHGMNMPQKILMHQQRGSVKA